MKGSGSNETQKNNIPQQSLPTQPKCLRKQVKHPPHSSTKCVCLKLGERIQIFITNEMSKKAAEDMPSYHVLQGPRPERCKPSECSLWAINDIRHRYMDIVNSSTNLPANLFANGIYYAKPSAIFWLALNKTFIIIIIIIIIIITKPPLPWLTEVVLACWGSSHRDSPKNSRDELRQGLTLEQKNACWFSSTNLANLKR